MDYRSCSMCLFVTLVAALVFIIVREQNFVYMNTAVCGEEAAAASARVASARASSMTSATAKPSPLASTLTFASTGSKNERESVNAEKLFTKPSSHAAKPTTALETAPYSQKMSPKRDKTLSGRLASTG